MQNNEFSEARKNMVLSHIRPDSVHDKGLLRAIFEVPREDFVPLYARAAAYVDATIRLNSTRQMLQPSVLARMIDVARITHEDAVLSIGSSTGYSTAILAKLANKVIAVESDTELSSHANSRFQLLDLDNVIVINKKLTKGHEDGGPYDVIIINGAIHDIPPLIMSQLKPGGRLVALMQNKSNINQITLVERYDDIHVVKKMDVVLAELLPGFEKKSRTTKYQIN